MSKEKTIGIHAPAIGRRTGFTAGVVLDENGRVVRAAPIIKWMLGWSEADVRQYVIERGWRLQ